MTQPILAHVPATLHLTMSGSGLDLTVDWGALASHDTVLEMQWSEETPYAHYLEISLLERDGLPVAARCRLIIQLAADKAPSQFTFLSAWTTRVLTLPPDGCLDNASSSLPWITKWIAGDVTLLAVHRDFRPILTM